MSENKHGTRSAEAVVIKHTESRELVCALVDGELDQALVPRAVDECKSGDWATYHLIGDIMRRSDVTPVSETFAARMAAALEREPAHRPEVMNGVSGRVLEGSSSPEPAGWRRWVAWPTIAVSAAVASIVWVAQPLFESDPSQVALTSPVTAPVVNESALSDYTEAHRQWAGPISIQQASFMPGGTQ